MTRNDLIGIIGFLFLVDLNAFHEGPNRHNIIRSGFSSKFKWKHLYCVVQATESIRPEDGLITWVEPGESSQLLFVPFNSCYVFRCQVM